MKLQEPVATTALIRFVAVAGGWGRAYRLGMDPQLCPGDHLQQLFQGAIPPCSRTHADPSARGA
jgi:hypothetical protein